MWIRHCAPLPPFSPAAPSVLLRRAATTSASASVCLRGERDCIFASPLFLKAVCLLALPCLFEGIGSTTVPLRDAYMRLQAIVEVSLTVLPDRQAATVHHSSGQRPPEPASPCSRASGKMTALTTTSSTLSATLPSVPKPPPRAPVARLRLRSRRRALLRCDAVSELAPAASAAYGVLLLGGGVFACTARSPC